MSLPGKIWLYRITHIHNLLYILQNGIYTSTSPHFDPNYKNIGDSSLINYRKGLDACDPPGGKLSEYVPFYLGPRSPMLYQIARGYEDIPKHAQEDIVYLISSVDQVEAHNLSYFFTDGHARSDTSAYYNKKEDFDRLDWDTIYSTHWISDETDLRRKSKKQSELLVKEHLPITAVDYIGVFNKTAEQKVSDLLAEADLNINIRISPAKLFYDHL
ncbi:DUF4433 domain-containing protein [Mucilaginibacter sp. ZT4R22]|uniref:DUF4433 domain-containing protein n=1 Tax=Mucilaginibacter pankratovii TaxID=2772110 RepID=A0ABR7WPI7_9SPHI|nr:DUF4433 domain-containing protein [Mucilaginibacter pankratovii]MBD1363397.1 DUF4433 domain-containing protein [Mucilaginibacter pankratovii]